MYNSALLDEIHYHFPALMYEPELFQSISDVFAYIRYQMRQRYDLFSANQRSYARLNHLPWVPPAAHDVLPTRFPPAGPVGAPRVAAPRVAPRVPREEIHVTLDAFDLPDPIPGGLLGVGTPNLDFLTALMNLTTGAVTANARAAGGAPAGGAAAGAMEPVIVRPTREQIDAGTSLEIVDAEEDVCAICQDTMEAGSRARAINACDHRFHVGCIDTWFQRNVRCPVCRHDVRDPPLEGDADDESTGSVS